jgi:hypothetical protein
VLPLSASCTSDQRFAFSFLRIPSRPGHPCRPANTSPCRVCRGLSPPSKCAMPGTRSPCGRSTCPKTAKLSNRLVVCQGFELAASGLPGRLPFPQFLVIWCRKEDSIFSYNLLYLFNFPELARRRTPKKHPAPISPNRMALWHAFMACSTL